MITALITRLAAKALLLVEALREGAELHRAMRRRNPVAFGHE